MKEDILHALERVPFFTINAYRQMAGHDADDAYHARIDLARAVESGQIIRLKNGVYMSNTFYRDHRRDNDFSAAVSAMLVPHSYLSLQSILQRAGILTEATRITTAVTTKSSRTIENVMGTFNYQHVKPALYKGYTLRSYYGVPFAQASPAKALFDMLYLAPIAAATRSPHFDLVEEMRLNLDDFPAEEQMAFHRFCEESGVQKMALISNNLKEGLWKT